jgi:hypothetical protein
MVGLWHWVYHVRSVWHVYPQLCRNLYSVKAVVLLPGGKHGRAEAQLEHGDLTLPEAGMFTYLDHLDQSLPVTCRIRVCFARTNQIAHYSFLYILA